jgi:transposase
MHEAEDGSNTAGLREAPKPATVERCHRVIDGLATQVRQLSRQLAILQERLGLDSSDSSKPPSSEGPGQGNRAQRRAGLRKRRAQPGHQGSYRALPEPEQVDRVIDCQPPGVCGCGAPVAALPEEPLRHQILDVPPIRAQVHEYRRHAGRCTTCGKAHRAAPPAGVPRGQIGPRAPALIGVLGTHHHLTQHKIRDLPARVMGVDFGVGAISQARGLVAQALAAPLEPLRAAVTQATLKHLDETRYPREGGGNRAWGVVTPQVAVFELLPSRARYVAQGLTGEQPRGTVVSDRYAAYDRVDAAQRQVCRAHLLRDFTRMGQRAGQAGRIGRCLPGAGYVSLRRRKQDRNAARFEPLRRRVRRLLEQGRAQTHCTRTAATCANVLKLESALWTFLGDPAVPPTNNEAERSLRTLVPKRKISGPTRSRRGDGFIARGFSVFETCRRQGRDLWNFMHESVLAWIDKTSPPSLVPAATPCG